MAKSLNNIDNNLYNEHNYQAKFSLYFLDLHLILQIFVFYCFTNQTQNIF
jgi:hypothetical protein